MKPTEPKRARDEALDWVKGALVVLMVVYHSLNYSPYTHVAFDYIAFLPPSFIFVAGFLLTNSYLARYDLKDWRLHQRLVMRGAKLILLFTALNVGLYFIALGPAAVEQFAGNVRSIYLATGGRVASFSILTSIGYLLLLAPLLLMIASMNRWVLPALALVLFIFCSVVEWRGSVSYHLALISAGIVGTAFGLLPLERVTGFARKWFIVVPLYCLYRTGSYFIGEPYAMQLTGVVTGLLVLYSLALTLSLKRQIYRQIVLLGRYSLLGYIIQLGIIQVIVRVFGPFDTPLAVLILAVVTLAATWAVTLLIHWLRPKARFVDLTYKAAFA
jgi:fucose 4-O-acetylase-like acetyltransferase